MNYNIKAIKKLDLFAGIKETDLEGIISCIGCQIKNFSKGQFILLESDEVKWIHIVLSGTVHTLKQDIWGNETILSVSKENSFSEKHLQVQIILFLPYHFMPRETLKFFPYLFIA